MQDKNAFDISSEFAWVKVQVDDSGLGPRLLIQDMRTGRVGYLDALELEMLAWTPHESLAWLVNPAFSRWRSHDDQSMPSFMEPIEGFGAGPEDHSDANGTP